MKLSKIYNYLAKRFGQTAFAFASGISLTYLIMNKGIKPYFLPNFDIMSFIFGSMFIASALLALNLSKSIINVIDFLDKRKRG